MAELENDRTAPVKKRKTEDAESAQIIVMDGQVAMRCIMLQNAF